MSDQTPDPTAAKPAATPKPPKKLVPRTAPKAEAGAPAPAVAAEAEAKAAEKVVEQVAEQAVKAAKPARRPAKADAAAAQRRQVLAEALVEARAINCDQPQRGRAPEAKPKKAAKNGKGDGAAKPKKSKLVRDSYAMPDAEYARIGELKKRLGGLGVEIKKSELLRAGLLLLVALSDDELKAVAGRVERIKTGRPAK